MVEVFKTNVTDSETADKIISKLALHLPQSRINFDLTDCDNILRIESSEKIVVESVTEHLSGLGYFCEVLEN
jgi:hypothetical protein